MKASKINIECDEVARQGLLFDMPGVKQNPAWKPGPNVYTEDREVFDQILYEAASHAYPIGIDFEFRPNYEPTIVGISDEERCVGMRWNKELGRALLDTMAMGVQFIAYSTAGADKPVLDKAMGVVTPEESWGDGMITHYLANSDFCKMPAKSEDAGDSGVMGFMNLWTAVSLVSDIQQYKICRGKVCEGPCPTHDVLGYCAVDAWAGLISHVRNWEQSVGKHISPEFFRDTLELCECTHAMEQKGVMIDKRYVDKMDKDMGAKKEVLFPRKKGIDGQELKEYEWFNPNAPMQGIEYFKKRGIRLEKGDKATLKKAVIKLAGRSGYPGNPKSPLAGLENAGGDITSPLLELYHWYLYKSEGKGISSWFKDRHIPVVDSETGLGLAHPRWIIPATCTGRISSANPNYHNIPARGWGSYVRKAVVPRDPKLLLLKADYSQLELRMCLYLAGVDPREIKGDAFMWLVGKASEDFAQGARVIGGGMNERDVAKSVSHAGDYLEGFTVLSHTDLRKMRIQQMIKAGALKVYEDWEFRGGVVAFTGANLAERMFGDKSWENRAKALHLQEEIYFKNFPMLRTEFHRKLTKEIDHSRMIVSKTGRFMHLYGTAEEDAKRAAAFLGQGTSAIFVQDVMLDYYRAFKRGDEFSLPTLQVHDELDFELPLEWGKEKLIEFVQPMVQESKRLPGFICPIKAKIGQNWNEDEMETIFSGGI